jgi:hypothetical protein
MECENPFPLPQSILAYSLQKKILKINNKQKLENPTMGNKPGDFGGNIGNNKVSW